jgi:hypothetical protein
VDNLFQEREGSSVNDIRPLSNEADILHISTHSASSRDRKHRLRKRRTKSHHSDEDIVTDYLNNLRDNGELDFFFEQIGHNQRELGGTDTEVVFGCSDSDDETHSSWGIHEKTNPQLTQGEGEDRKFFTDSPKESTAKSDEDDLVKLVAAQNLSSTGATGPETQTSDSGCSDINLLRRHEAGKQDEFDFMDWSQANMRPKKGRAYPSGVSFDHCDPDVEAQLQMAWNSSRLKKKERKRHREELRALGMLKKNAKGDDDMRSRYPLGMTVEQVGEEMRLFLLNEEEV